MKQTASTLGVFYISKWGTRAGLKVDRDVLINNLLVRIHFVIVMIRWTGLAPWVFESPLPGAPTRRPSTSPACV